MIWIDLLGPPQYRDHSYQKEKTMAGKKNFPFEESITKLEALVERMEDGNLSLEESLKTFEQGIKLTRECQLALQTAEQKVKLLIEKNGSVEETPFAAEPGDD